MGPASFVPWKLSNLMLSHATVSSQQSAIAATGWASLLRPVNHMATASRDIPLSTLFTGNCSSRVTKASVSLLLQSLVPSLLLQLRNLTVSIKNKRESRPLCDQAEIKPRSTVFSHIHHRRL
ncbi:hypothetical protein E4U55_000966 [Claviceps digitariae]|nr:hypothetical protein E4U55_000966 [Claviceps digitariae]